MTQREQLEEWAEEWIAGSRTDIVRSLQFRGRSVTVAFCRVLVNKLGKLSGETEMRTLEILLSNRED